MPTSSGLAIEMTRATFNAALNAGSKTYVEMLEKVTRLQTESTARMLAENAPLMNALLGNGGSAAAPADWAKLIEDNLRHSTEVTRSLWEITAKAQADMVELGAKLVVVGSESLSESLERIGRTLEASTSTMVKVLANVPERVAAEAPARKRAA
jgi:Phasin protein